MKLKILSILAVILILLGLCVNPVSAISNPNTIEFGYFKAFYNVLETNDFLIVAEGKVIYNSLPTDYTASQAFTFDLLDTTGTTTIVSTALQSFGDRPISIYLSASQVTSLLGGLTIGTPYVIRIMGNPLIFASSTGNSVTGALTVYVNQLLGVDNGNPQDNNLRNFIIQMATAIQTYDGTEETDPYLKEVQGYSYLTTSGSNIFNQGIPNLYNMCPIAFESGVETMGGNAPTSYTGAYQSVITPEQQWGSTAARGLTNVGVYLGVSQQLAGSIILLCLMVGLAIFLYAKTQSGVSVLVIVAVSPAIGAYLGLVPIALAFALVIVIVTLLGYYFFSHGAL